MKGLTAMKIRGVYQYGWELKSIPYQQTYWGIPFREGNKRGGFTFQNLTNFFTICRFVSTWILTQ